MARRRSNTGIPGLSFSWKRALGVSTAKRQIARYTGIPTTRQGRQAKIGRSMGCLIPTLMMLFVPALVIFCVIL
jgi:hypothetical protein